jgi:hypothetical protein
MLKISVTVRGGLRFLPAETSNTALLRSQLTRDCRRQTKSQRIRTLKNPLVIQPLINPHHATGIYCPQSQHSIATPALSCH